MKLYALVDPLTKVDSDIKEIVSERPQAMMLKLCLQYWQEHAHKVTCFQDLRTYICILDGNERNEFFAHTLISGQQTRPQSDSPLVSQCRPKFMCVTLTKEQLDVTKWFTREINHLKADWLLTVAPFTLVFKIDRLESLVCQCIRLYNLSLRYDFKLPPSDRLPGDDAALLAVMGLVRMFKMKGRRMYFRNGFHYAALLLECALTRSKHNYDFLLTLVRLYTSMGLGALAMAKYHQLSIKNLQHITLSWIMFTRISTMHPHPATVNVEGKGRITIDPAEEMASILKWHAEAVELNSRSIWQVQKNNSWTMQIDAANTQTILHDGFARCLMIAELSAVRRIRFPDTVPEFRDQPLNLPRQILDTRDRKPFPNYEHHANSRYLTFEEQLPSPAGEEVDVGWLADNLWLVQFWGILSLDEFHALDHKSLLSLKEYYANWKSTATETERKLIALCDKLMELTSYVTGVLDGGSWNSKATKQTLHLLKQAQDQNYFAMKSLKTPKPHDVTSDGLRYPSSRVLNDYYGRLQMFQFTYRALDFIQKKNLREGNQMAEVPKKAIENAKIKVREHASTLWYNATTYRADIASRSFTSGMRQELGDDPVGKALRQSSFGNKEVEDVCKFWRDGWLDAWDGFIKTKLC